MIDLHCHLLPGVDDGPRDDPEAVALARAAVANGIDRCVLTPHMHEGRFDNDLASLRSKTEQFRSTLRSHGVNLELGLAAEVRIGPEVLDWLQEDQIPFLGVHGGRRVLLLEFPHDQIPPGADRLIERLTALGIQPMIAHPERNLRVIRDPDALRPFLEAGCLLQITAGSVTGSFSQAVRSCARQILENGWVHIMATDAHNLAGRAPILREGAAAAAEIVGEAESKAMVEERPWQLARGHFD